MNTITHCNHLHRSLVSQARERRGLRVDPAAIDKHLLDIARTAMRVNLAKELERLDQAVEKRIRALVA